MSNFAARRLGLFFVLAVLCLDGRMAHGQSAPMPYWIPSWPFGFGGNLNDGQNAYGNFLGFDSTDARGSDLSHMRYNFANGWFAVAEGGGMGLSMNGINQYGAFDNLRSFSYQGAQVGYNFKSAAGLPFTVYAGLDTLKYDTGIGGPVPFDTTSGTLTGYSAHTGIEFQPAPNVSLSLGLGYTQQPGR